MNINKTLIKATAETYTREELLTLRKDAVEQLQETDTLISASTGAGASYTTAQRRKAEELVELYSLALEYKDNGVFYATDAEVLDIVFYR